MPLAGRSIGGERLGRFGFIRVSSASRGRADERAGDPLHGCAPRINGYARLCRRPQPTILSGRHEGRVVNCVHLAKRHLHCSLFDSWPGCRRQAENGR